MALINCPECNTAVSESAAACLRCAFPINTLIKCPDCGTYAREGASACAECGCLLRKPVAKTAPTPLPAAYSQYSLGAESEDLDELFGPVSDVWAWMLGSVPITGWILEEIIGRLYYGNVYALVSQNTWLGIIVFFGMNITFFMLDAKELKQKGRDTEGWMWLGLILVPIYLFLRASKVNKKYGYAVLWCVLFGVYLIAGGGSFALNVFEEGYGNNATTSSYNSSNITLEQYNRIQTDMTYEEVRKIMGTRGELLYETDMGAVGRMSAYSWEGSSFTANVEFHNGRVFSKMRM